ncbi:hypothetical protein J2W83_003104 [Pseudomonas hunanensis]|uniref:Uncharacterized protein n=1 Tax=Pseudomonas hunanensis TaxID=1247546 RepID=A0ACC6K4U4_9PSED|nr:hypothetical protein [Pseudomonas hunanensis]
MSYLILTNLSNFEAGQYRSGTLAIWPVYGAGNPRFCVSDWFTSLVNCGELVNPPYSLGKLDI